MGKDSHEIRDPIHVFAYFDSDERSVINSRPFQRLRSIHQLALTYLVYPGATHKRFEHSIGVMELAERVFKVITQKESHPGLPEKIPIREFPYWRKTLRIAALCHDLGHLPFSHAAEKELLPKGWNHERLTVEILRSDEMKNVFARMIPPVEAEHVVKIAVGEKELSKFEATSFTPWESLLSEIITGNAFGVDRMDYLLRDSYHSGVAYGRFDHYRLIDTLQILPVLDEREERTISKLGVEVGGLHSAEALLLARYFMFSQLYMHSVRRIYDIHLKDFLKAWLSGGMYSTDVEQHLRITDNEVAVAFCEISRDTTHPAHEAACRLALRNHYKVLYVKNPEDMAKNPQAVTAIYESAVKEFGLHAVILDEDPGGSTQSPKFPVAEDDSRVVWSLQESPILREKLPPVTVGRVYITPNLRDKAKSWLESHRTQIIENHGEGIWTD